VVEVPVEEVAMEEEGMVEEEVAMEEEGMKPWKPKLPWKGRP
jgi:hypothetical protein